MMMTEQQARRRAKAVCKQLGPGWEPEVWENLGWHYKAVLHYSPNGMIVVHCRPGSYFAGVSNARAYPGMIDTGPNKRNARAALTALLQQLRIEIRHMQGAIDAALAQDKDIYLREGGR